MGILDKALDKIENKITKEIDRGRKRLDGFVGDVEEGIGRPLGNTVNPNNPFESVPDPDNMRFPLEDDTYKATVTFTVLEEKYTGNNQLISETIQKEKESQKALEDAKAEREENGENPPADIADKTKDFIKQSMSNVIAPKTVVAGKSVTLYMPLGLTFNDNVAYRNAQLGQLGATMETGMGIAGAMAQGIGSFIENFSGPKAAAGDELAKLAAISLGKKIPSVGAEAAMVAQVTGGVTLNPNERAIFDQPNIREFAFNFKMIAKNRTEQNQINAIIRHMRTELYPDDIVAPVGNGEKISLGYKFPNKFRIEFAYDGQQIPGLAKIQPCFLKGVDTVFNATQMAFHDDANFMEVDMTLRFQETRALTKKEIKEGF